MIEKITSQFDWVFQMPIEAQCHFAIGLSLSGFLFAAIVRETCKESSVRYVARAVGAASFFAVAAFAHHVAHENEKLNSELMVKQTEKTREIASEKLVTLTTKNGYQIKIGEENGVRGTGSGVRSGDGQLRQRYSVREFSAAGLTASSVGNNGSDGPSYDGLDALAKLSEWARRYAWDGGNERCFEYSGEVQGESF